MTAAETQLLPIYLPSLEEAGANSRIGQDKDKPVLGALYAAMGNMWQTVEDANFDLVGGLLFATATGVALDRWGQIVGQTRLGMVDADYRRMIGARILINHCGGTPDEFAAIVRVIAETTRAWTVTLSGGLYAVCYQSYTMTPGLRRALARAMDDVRLLGRQAELLESTPTGLVLAGQASDLLQVPTGYESRLDNGTLGRQL